MTVMDSAYLIVAVLVACALGGLLFKANRRNSELAAAMAEKESALRLAEERRQVAEAERGRVFEELAEARIALEAEVKSRHKAQSAEASALATVEAMKRAETVALEQQAVQRQAVAEREGELKRAVASEREKLDKAEKQRADAERLLEGERRARREEQQAFEARVAELKELKKQMEDAFARLSNDALAKNNEQFISFAKQKLDQLNQQNAADLEKRQQAVAELLKPLREQMERVGQSVDTFDKGRAESFATILEKMEALRLQEESLRKQTQTLGDALRKPGVRGAWGEMQMERCAQFAGLEEGVHYKLQEQVTPQDRPDMIVYMPNGLQVIVDSKVPWESYSRAVDEPDAEKARALMKDHARQTRDKVLDLAKKNYPGKVTDSIDFTVLFMPNEALFSEALKEDPTLLQMALESRILVASPTTLIALLHTVSAAWRQKALTENAQELKSQSSELYKRLCVFLGHLSNMGKGLERAIKSYNQAVGSMDHNLLVQARRINELGGFDSEEERLREASPQRVDESEVRAIRAPELPAECEAEGALDAR